MLLIDRFAEVSMASDLPSFESLLVSMAKDMGFDIVTGALVVEDPSERGKHGYFCVSNCPPEFLEAAKDATAIRRDPVARRLHDTSVPFLYDQELYVKEQAADLWEEQASFGFKSGIAVALHLPGHRHFLLGVDRDGPLPASPAELTRCMADVQLLAIYAQAAASKLLAPEPGAPGVPKLSAREVEVLNWTREGKSNWEIGKILDISEEGVRYHLKSLFRKLGATSKHHAVLKAISLGLLPP
jgi:DNA-binding CsgD family transcriptional regulator